MCATTAASNSPHTFSNYIQSPHLQVNNTANTNTHNQNQVMNQNLYQTCSSSKSQTTSQHIQNYAQQNLQFNNQNPTKKSFPQTPQQPLYNTSYETLKYNYQSGHNQRQQQNGSMNNKNFKSSGFGSNNGFKSAQTNKNPAISKQIINKSKLQTENVSDSKHKATSNDIDDYLNVDEEENAGDLNEPRLDYSDKETKSITVQLYNLKQNLTKKMLQDLLEPYVTSIDFKSKTIEPNNNLEHENNLNNKTNYLDYASSNLIINEENVDVFIKFENLDKLNEALRSFNLESMRDEMGDEISVDNNSYAREQEKQLPFLLKPLKPITIF